MGQRVGPMGLYGCGVVWVANYGDKQRRDDRERKSASDNRCMRATVNVRAWKLRVCAQWGSGRFAFVTNPKPSLTDTRHSTRRMFLCVLNISPRPPFSNIK